MSNSPALPAISSRVPAVAFACLATAWLLLVLASPYIVSHAGPRDLAFQIGGMVYMAGRAVCHQRPGRSFHAWGVQLPVCARCFGLYAGAVLGSGLQVVTFSRPRGSGLQVGIFSRLTPLAVFLIAGAPTLVSVGLEVMGIWRQTPLVRCLAALPLGFAVACFVAAHAAEVFRRQGNL